ncbi:MAG: hypothetical protein MUO70_01020 [Euryarchaeota archaeon]|jgi:hypothetical protein|nr:hypothetical protein [Euryarchaeota archaeon]
MDIRTAIAPQFNNEGRIELVATVTYDDLLDKLGELSAEFADLDYMVRLLKREQNDVAGLDTLLHELSGFIKTVGDRLILLKTELPE